MNPLFVTGIGTGIGKSLVSAILVEALQADYWKPVQAGAQTTDSEWIKQVISNKQSKIFPETYCLKMPASPHISARLEGKTISIEKIKNDYIEIAKQSERLIIEGAGGLLVPLNQEEFVIDLIRKLNADVILVSRNYLGSINHSILTAKACQQNKLNVKGWIFNDQYLDYEHEIVDWSGYQKLGSVPKASEINSGFIQEQAELLKKTLI